MTEAEYPYERGKDSIGVLMDVWMISGYHWSPLYSCVAFWNRCDTTMTKIVGREGSEIVEFKWRVMTDRVLIGIVRVGVRGDGGE